MIKEIINNIPIVRNDCATNPSTALILMHGRGANAEGIMSLLSHLEMPERCIVIAPKADNHTWYPNRFIAPQADNEPYLSKSLEVVSSLLLHLKSVYQLDTTHIILVGFSQGACLVAEYVKHQPRRYGGVVIMSGGVIGTDAEAAAVSLDEQSLNGTPIYIGCDKNDFHIPVERVLLTDNIMQKLGADTHLYIYENFGHAIHSDAISFLSARLQVIDGEF